MRRLFTSESVSEGHPDKIADQISDAVLDAMLADDSRSRVACETLVTTGQVIVSGEVINLKKQAALGTFSGPVFEANLETERGKGVVRFLLTNQGIELMAERLARTMN